MAPPKVISAKYDVEKFTGHNNFTLWQVQMQDVLVSQGLGVILKGKSESMTNEDWEDYSARALSMIRLHLGQEVLLQVYTEDTPIKLWTRLETMYKKKFLSTKLYTALKLMTYKMAEGTKLNNHIDVFNLIVAELASLDEKVEEVLSLYLSHISI
ncbi:unnamed protein product [Calypogeia fissa]